jgi:hypothetical protein
MMIVTNDKDRNMTRTQYRFRNTTDQMPAHPTRPMRPHHDKIRFECLSRLHEGARDARAVCIDYLSHTAYPAAYPTMLAQLVRINELPVHTRFGARVFSASSARDIAHIVGDNPCHHQHRIDEPRQLYRLFKRKARTEAAVERHQNSFVHDCPPDVLPPSVSACRPATRLIHINSHGRTVHAHITFATARYDPPTFSSRHPLFPETPCPRHGVTRHRSAAPVDRPA